MEEIFYLDLHKNELYGWEPLKNKERIDSIVDGIRKNDNFPAVPVHRTIDNQFFLSKNILLESGLIDGGHHRAVAHYITRKPLKCKLIDGQPRAKEYYLLIRDIQIS
jgi:hypothetical protein